MLSIRKSGATGLPAFIIHIPGRIHVLGEALKRFIDEGALHHINDESIDLRFTDAEDFKEAGFYLCGQGIKYKATLVEGAESMRQRQIQYHLNALRRLRFDPSTHMW